MLSFLFDLIYPPVSIQGKHGEWLTPEEVLQMRPRPVRFEHDDLVQHGLPSVDRLVAAASYRDAPLVQEAVRRFKYRRIRAYEALLGSHIAAASLLLPEWPALVLCPVPLHWTREFARGFNQSHVLAQALAEKRGWSVQELLTRTRSTGAQARRSHDERRAAMRGAFSFSGDDVPMRVVLVDDVVTTGATLEACARALKDAGVQHVDALTLAVAFA